MELLAPVGSKESFTTAIRAGADAIYIGVPDFNARLSASKISLYDLEVLIDHARKTGVKVYLALNTLIKHEEISDVVKSITVVDRLSPDAVIIQDLGVANIIKKYFPNISLHASTQMAVHNRMGVEVLAQQGFKRAIMARELSFAELKIIAKGSPIPIEVFCHGALCFCLSGMCLFSSFIGGLSGNRGRCTQPCRRRWENGKKEGYIFSPKDLELAEQVGKLKDIGIAALKIEGRMRSSEYVYRTVKAYRLLIDASENDFNHALKEAKTILSGDMAREKTTCLFSGRDNSIFQPQKAQCLGNLIGKIDAIGDSNISIELVNDSVKIVDGDRLRISNPDTDTTIAFKIKEFSKEGSNYVIPFGKAREFRCGNPVYKTVDTEFDQKNIEQEIDSIYEKYAGKNHRRKRIEQKTSQTYTALISNKWKEMKKMGSNSEGEEFLFGEFSERSRHYNVEVSERRRNEGQSPSCGALSRRQDRSSDPDATSGCDKEDSLWIRFDNILWLDLLPKPGKNSRYIFYMTKENLHLSDKIPEADKLSTIAVELPPFIGQRDTPLFKQTIDKMVSRGIKKWVINNVSQFGFFEDSECELSAGQFLYTWNAYTAAFLSELGVKYFTASWEDDFLNIRKMCGPGLGKQMVVYLYGFVPIVRSRIITKEMLSGELIRDHSYASGKHENRTPVSFSPVFESELTLLIPEKPVNIFTARKKFKECGISNFGIDLNFIKPDKKLWNTVISAYELQENIPDTLKFNFKRGVK